MLREVLYFEDVIYRLESLMVYTKVPNDEVLVALNELSAAIASSENREVMTSRYYVFVKKLLNKAEEMGYSGHLLKQHILYLFLMDSNHLSIACNNRADVKKSTLYKMALKDMGVLQYFMDFDLQNLCDNAGYGEKIYDYTPTNPHEHPELDQLSSLKSGEELLEQLIWYYTNMGDGALVGVSMLRVDENGELVAIHNRSEISFRELPGYKRQIQALKENTEAFLNGKQAGTLLLTGSVGVGKYACLTALADQYADKGLRLVEIGKNRFRHMEKILKELSRRHNNFILIADELSIDDVTSNYDYLKYCLGASLEACPKNVLLYAASSHNSPTGYFDDIIKFSEMTETEFQDAVAVLAKQMKVQAPVDFLKEQALAWVVNKPERSVATAREYVKQVIWELKQQ